MPIKILMPALSPTMEHGNLAKWIKKEGDKIVAGDVIAEIETDKATMEVESVDEGILAKIIIPEGTQEVSVNSLIAVLLEEDEDESVLAAFLEKEANNKITKKEDSKESSTDELQDQSSIKSEPVSTIVDPEDTKIDNTKKRLFISPLAKNIAKSKNVDLSTITGTGPHGRIVKSDILLATSNIKGRVVRSQDEYKLVPNSNMRKIIAKRLLDSKQTVPHFYLSIECMMDNLLKARIELNSKYPNDKEKRLSVNDFVILAVAKALKDVPEANASWSQEAIKMYNNVDVSVAVAIDGGLITPIIHNADQKSIYDISIEMKDLAKRARSNSLKPEEFQGGGFSISNLGMYGVKSFNAIVNPPQACILAVGMSNKRAVIIDDKVETRMVMDVNLSCDHRVVDGAVGAKFLAAFKKYMESPILMFV